MRPEQLELIVTVGTPSITPDGRWAVVSTRRADLATDGYTGQLWLVPTAQAPAQVGEEQTATGRRAMPRRLTRGYADGAPQVSPDGRSVAFLRGAVDAAPQLAVIPLDGGEAQVLTDRRLGVQSFAWSPQGDRLVFCSAEPQQGRYGTVEDVDARHEDPRLITGPSYRVNGVGYTEDRRTRLYEIPAPDLEAEPRFAPRGRAADGDEVGRPLYPEPVALTDGEREVSAPIYTGDGRQVLYTTSVQSGFERDLRSGIAVVESGRQARDAETRAAENRASETVQPRWVVGGPESTVSFDSACLSRDGAWLYVLGADLGSSGQDFVASTTAVYRVSTEGLLSSASRTAAEAAEPQRLTDPAHVNCSGGPLTSFGADGVLALAEVRGRTVPVVLGPEGTQEMAGQEQVDAAQLSVSAAAEGAGTLVLAGASLQTPGGLWALSTGDGTGSTAASGLRQLLDPNAALREQTGTVHTLEREYPSGPGDDGQEAYPVHGWVHTPEGDGPFPVLLNIHGGPFAQYTSSWFDETQVLVEAGYAVVMCNPRGSDGYGAAHGAAVRHRIGTVDRQDILAFLDGALAEFGTAAGGPLDESRLGVMGGSYGGLMTGLIIAEDHRFQGAVVERGYLDPLSALGSSDIGWFFTPEYFGTDPQAVQAQSPLAQVQHVRTPTLVMHSEEDWRCPLEHAQRYYQALWAQGVESELLIFPGENHELSRSGTPWHRQRRFEHLLRWWERRLPVAGGRA